MKSLLLGVSIALACGLAQAEPVIIVSAKSPIANLSKDQAADIFLGKALDVNGTPVVLADAADAGLRDDFYSKLTGRSAAQVKAAWSKLLFTGKGTPPKELGSAAEIKQFVAGNPQAVGYIDKSALDGSVKSVLAVH